KENTVQGIELYVSPAKKLLAARIGQDHDGGRVFIQIDELNAGVIFGGGAGDIVGGIYGDAVDETEAESGFFGESALGQIRKAQHRNASEAAIAAPKNCLVGLRVVGDRRGHTAEIKRVCDLDDWAKGIRSDIGTKN